MDETVQKVKRPPVAKKIDISDATIIEESANSNDSTISDKKPIDVDNEYVKNLQNQETIDLGEAGKKQAGEKVVIDFMNEEHINSFTAGTTKKAEENDISSNSNFQNKSVDDLKAEIKKAEDESTKNFTAKDFEDIARFMIFLIDTGLSSGLKWWSGDSSDAAYSLPEKKKEMLVYQLTLILTKYQAKFSIEFMFILTILIVYAPAFIKAKNKKKEIKALSEQSNEEYQVQLLNNLKSEKIVENASESIKMPNIPKRKRGNPGKA